MSDVNEMNLNEMNLGPRWYVAHTYSGYENKVKANLEKLIENRGLGHLIFDIRIPVETVTEKQGDGEDEKEVEIKTFPSYVLVKMIMNNESWHVVRNIRGVTGFVGPGSKPVPLTDEEVEAMNVDLGSSRNALELGSRVKIVRGLFEGFVGTLQGISEDGKTVTVIIKTGPRDMPVKLDAADVKEAEEEI
jgi:transcriptional antiterminator NusG